MKTTDIDAAKERAFDEEADLRFRIKHDVPGSGSSPQPIWSAKRWISQAAAGPGGVSVRYIAWKA